MTAFRRALVIVLLFGPALASVSLAQDAPGFEMTTYQMVLLSKGAKYATLSPSEAKKLDAAHEANLEQILLDDSALIGGAIEGDGALREVVVLKVKTSDEAKARFADDPIVKSERLAIEVRSWYAAKDILRKPEEPSDTETCTLGFFLQGHDVKAGAPNPQDLMPGHLGNITHMAELGDLVIAGPLGAGSERRGVLLFRITGEKRIRELVSEDPMVKAGHLTLELFRWKVPKGTLPPRAEKKDSVDR
jgi:hypothetical protein